MASESREGLRRDIGLALKRGGYVDTARYIDRLIDVAISDLRAEFAARLADATRPETAASKPKCPKCGSVRVTLQHRIEGPTWFHMNCLDCKHWESSPSDWTEPLPPRGAGREPDAARLLDLIGDIRRIVASSSWVREAVDNSMTCREADRWMGETRRVLEDAGRPVTRIDLEAPEPAPDKLREELADALFNIRDIILDDPKGLEWLREYMGPTTFNAWFDKTFDLLRRSGKLSPTS